MRSLIFFLLAVVCASTVAEDDAARDAVIGNSGGVFYRIAPGKDLVIRAEVISRKLSYLQLFVGGEKRDGFYIEDYYPRGLNLILDDCSRGGPKEEIIVALVTHDDDKEILDDVHAAWRYDTELETLVAISPRGVTCINISYGE
jgi:hypothetical protein